MKGLNNMNSAKIQMAILGWRKFAVATVAVAAAVLAFAVGNVQASVVANWDYNEGAGSFTYDGVGSLTASITLGATPATWVSSGDFNGAFGTSLRVNGNPPAGLTQVVSAPYAGQFGAQTSGSWETWIKPDVYTDQSVAPQMFNMPNVDALLHVANGAFRLIWGGIDGGFNKGDGVNNYYLDLPAYSNKWMQLVGTYDGTTGTAKFYVNGVLAAGTSTMTGGTGLGWGASGAIALSGAFGYKGLIDHTRLFNTVLTPAEVLADYTQITTATGFIQFLPEPTSMSLVGLGGLLVLRGRRR